MTLPIPTPAAAEPARAGTLHDAIIAYGNAEYHLGAGGIGYPWKERDEALANLHAAIASSPAAGVEEAIQAYGAAERVVEHYTVKLDVDCRFFDRKIEQRDEALASLRAAIAAQPAPGATWISVPREPTPEMINAAVLAWRNRVRDKLAKGTIGQDASDAMVRNYKAMVDAAPLAPQSGRGVEQVLCEVCQTPIPCDDPGADDEHGMLAHAACYTKALEPDTPKPARARMRPQEVSLRFVAEAVLEAFTQPGMGAAQKHKAIVALQEWISANATPAQPVSVAGSEPVAWRYRDRSWFSDTWEYHRKRPVAKLYDIVEPLALHSDYMAEKARADKAEADREQLALAICGGEDVPGYAASLSVKDLEQVIADRLSAKEWTDTQIAELDAFHATSAPALAPQDGDLRAAAQAAFDTWLIDEDGSDTDKAMYSLRDALAAPPKPDVLPGLKQALEFIRTSCPTSRDRIYAEIARIEKERQS